MKTRSSIVSKVNFKDLNNQRKINKWNYFTEKQISVSKVLIFSGDSCCFPFSLGGFEEKLNASLQGVYIVSLEIGSNVIEDVENGYFMHPDKQINLACEMIASDPKLSNGFNAIGFSQGAQFL